MLVCRRVRFAPYVVAKMTNTGGFQAVIGVQMDGANTHNGRVYGKLRIK